jgi:hypothetical protein
MAKKGDPVINHSLGKNSHILISDPNGKLKNPKVTAIKDEKGNTWEFDQLASTMTGKKLRVRVRRKTGARSERADGDTGTLSVTLTDDDSTSSTIPVDVVYVDDPAAPC